MEYDSVQVAFGVEEGAKAVYKGRLYVSGKGGARELWLRREDSLLQATQRKLRSTGAAFRAKPGDALAGGITALGVSIGKAALEGLTGRKMTGVKVNNESLNSFVREINRQETRRGGGFGVLWSLPLEKIRRLEQQGRTLKVYTAENDGVSLTFLREKHAEAVYRAVFEALY